jgi:hypothetical protein
MGISGSLTFSGSLISTPAPWRVYVNYTSHATIKKANRTRPGGQMKRRELFASNRIGRLRRYAAAPAMIEALWPPKPKLFDITTRSFRSRGVFGV